VSDPAHLSLTLTPERWNELLQAALPVELGRERFDGLKAARRWARRLPARAVAGHLLPTRARPAWERAKQGLVARLDRLVHVRGEWTLEIDQLGSEVRFAPSEIAGDARIRGRVAATVELLQGRVEVPVRFDHLVHVAIRLGQVRYDPVRRAIVGEVGPVEVRAEHTPVSAFFAGRWLTRRVARANPVLLLPRERVEEMVGPFASLGAGRVVLGVEDLDVRIDHDQVKLLIRFGLPASGWIEDYGAEGT
jgi:hypothetical protein